MSAKHPSDRRRLHEALAHHQAGRLETAERLYRDILRAEPENADALHLCGLVAYQAGGFADAEALIRQAIAVDDRRAAYWSNLGNALKQRGKLDEAVAACQRALELEPDFATAAYNLANTLKDQGKLDAAVAAYERALASKPDYLEAHCNLGIALRAQGRLEAAVAVYGRALELEPDSAQVLNNLGLALHDQGELGRAVARYRRALEAEPDYAEAWNNLGNALRAQDELDEAVAAYRRALAVRPEDTEALCNLGVALRRQGKLEEAAAAYRQALHIDPGLIEARNNLGVALRQAGHMAEAVASFRQVLEINPRLVEARSNLGEIYEKTNRLDEAEALLAGAAPEDRAQPALRRLGATLLRRRGRLEAALAELAGLPEPATESRLAQRIRFELGLLHDLSGAPEAAMAEFAEGNRLRARSYEASRVNPAAALEGVRTIAARFTPDWVRGWRPGAHAGEAPAPIFIVGFPRSGTTLLDQVLDAHPGLQVLEERPCLPALARFLSETPAGYPGALAALDARTAAEAREVYAQAVARHIERTPGTTLVDKFPLNLIHMGLIQRLFPGAKVIFALRHPCDVCLSSFMQYVELNDAMANFLSLEASATFYDAVMGLWRRYAELLPTAFHTLRYEALVADFEGEIRAVIDYLDLDWDAAVLDYASHAKARKHIASPSYHQVTEPIYARAKYRWKRYEKHLAPVMDKLAPHIEYFGYGE